MLCLKLRAKLTHASSPVLLAKDASVNVGERLSIISLCIGFLFLDILFFLFFFPDTASNAAQITSTTNN